MGMLLDYNESPCFNLYRFLLAVEERVNMRKIKTREKERGKYSVDGRALFQES